MNLDKLRRQRVSACPVARHLTGITIIKGRLDSNNKEDGAQDEEAQEPEENEDQQSGAQDGFWDQEDLQVSEAKLRKMKEKVDTGTADELMLNYYNRVIAQLVTYDEAHMHLAITYSMRGPSKSNYFMKKGKSITDFTTNVTKYGSIERIIDELRELFDLKEEEDTFISDDD